MAHNSQPGGADKNESLASILYSKSDLKEGSLQWVKGKQAAPGRLYCGLPVLKGSLQESWEGTLSGSVEIGWGVMTSACKRRDLD